MRTSRRIAVAAAMTTALLLPVSARAGEGAGTCVGTSMQMLRTALRQLAREGGVRDLVQDIRTQPDAYPWC